MASTAEEIVKLNGYLNGNGHFGVCKIMDICWFQVHRCRLKMIEKEENKQNEQFQKQK